MPATRAQNGRPFLHDALTLGPNVPQRFACPSPRHDLESMAIVAERVNQFLTERGTPHCDRCIQRSLGLALSNQVQQITSALGTTSDFRRERGRCASCGNVKMVTIRTSAERSK